MKRFNFKKASQKVYKEYSLKDPAWREHLQAIPDPATNFEAYLKVTKQPVGFANIPYQKEFSLEERTEDTQDFPENALAAELYQRRRVYI